MGSIRRGRRISTPATCPACDDEFLPAMALGGKPSSQIYCSYACTRRYRMRRGRRLCRLCSRPAEIDPSQRRQRRTYCRDCKRQVEREAAAAKRAARPRVERFCRGCKTEITDLPSRTRYCSKQCQRRDEMLRNRYGIHVSDYETMLATQDGRCALCPATPNGRAFHVDHDHGCCSGRKTCGRCVRGLLCGRCNQRLGMFGDDPARLRAAADYLEGKPFHY